MFVLTSEITIGGFSFTGVGEVRTERGIHSYTDRAFIKIPSVSRVIQKSGSIGNAETTGAKFTDGQPVTIRLGYDGRMQTEFEGFVKRRSLGEHLEVECEGYSYVLRNKNITEDLSKGIKVKKLLELVTEGTGITVECPIDFTMYGRKLVNTNGCEALDEILKCSDKTLSLFFIEPKKLWCGLVYAPYISGQKVFDLPTVRYRIGYNCLDENGLRERVPNEKVQVMVNGRLATGDSVRTASDEKKDARKVKGLFNGVRDNNTLRSFANEKADRMNYAGYEGHVSGYLEPYCAPGYTAYIKDQRYPERDGNYLVEAVTVTFGGGGGRRKTEVSIQTKAQ